MAGEAKTTKFMLGTATVMLGPMADVFELTPDEHSIGLAKNFQINSDVSYVDLTQGISNDLVFSVANKNDMRAQCEVYEYTAKNLGYALGLDGSALELETAGTTTLTAAIDGTSAPVATLALTDADDFEIGDSVMVQGAEDDIVFVTKITGIAALNATVSPTCKMQFAIGAKVTKVAKVDMGAVENQPFFGAKIVGVLADSTPCTIIIPKVRVTKGFTLSFGTDQFGNMPFELSLYALVSTDALKSEFGKNKARLYV